MSLAAAIEQQSLREAGCAYSASVIAALAEAAGWNRAWPQPETSQDPLILARISRLVVVTGYLRDSGVIDGILAQMPEQEQRFLGQLARAHHAATRTEHVEGTRSRLLHALDETGRACRAASQEAYAHAETAARLNAAQSAGAWAFKSTTSQLYDAWQILLSPSAHGGRPSAMVLRISGMVVEARAGMVPGDLILTPLTGPEAPPRAGDRGLAGLMALRVPATSGPEVAADVEKHFHRVAGDLERLHLRELTDRETRDQISDAVQLMYRTVRTHQPLDASADGWGQAAFDEHCAQLTTLLDAPLQPLSSPEPAGSHDLGRSVAALGRRAHESHRAYREAPAPSGRGLYKPMIQDAVAHLKASVELVLAAGRVRPQPPPAAAPDAAAILRTAASAMPGLS